MRMVKLNGSAGAGSQFASLSGPGATVLTWMPLGPYMNALLLASPATACLEAV
jgi:hypothetical protein